MFKELNTATPPPNPAHPRSKDFSALTGIGTVLIFKLVKDSKVHPNHKEYLNMIQAAAAKRLPPNLIDPSITTDAQYWVAAAILAAYELGRHNTEQTEPLQNLQETETPNT